MKINLNNLCQKARYMAASAAVMFIPFIAKASGEGQQVLSNFQSELQSLGGTLVDLLKVILGMGALVTLIMAIFKILKKDRESAEHIAWWVAGFTIAFVGISVVQSVAGL